MYLKYQWTLAQNMQQGWILCDSSHLIVKGQKAEAAISMPMSIFAKKEGGLSPPWLLVPTPMRRLFQEIMRKKDV